MELRTEPRALRVLPRDLRADPPRPDRESRGRLAIDLSFGLPRGSYATLLVKCLLEPAPRELGERRRPSTVFRRPRRGENPAS
jgi:tRNA(Glu) U13 pseudouridine synthase TruD